MTSKKKSSGFYERAHRETSAAILSSAKTLLLKEGFAAVTVEAVAKRAGISRQRLYCYYPSLDAILYRIQIEDMKAFIAYVSQALAAAQGPSVSARLQDFLNRLFAYEAAQQDDFLFTYEFDAYYLHRSALDAALREEYASTYQDLSFVSAMAAFFEEGRQRGEFRRDLDPQAATSFWANLVQLLLERIAVFSANGENHSQAELAGLKHEVLRALFAYLR
jgi:AcrR family transcriptional regulator